MSSPRRRAYRLAVLPGGLLACLMVATPTLGTGPVTRRVSIDSAETQASGASYGASVSADGRYVAFTSAAGDLVANDTNGKRDVFVRDRQMGSTSRVSIRSSGAQATGADSSEPSISADGRYVAFQSDAIDLVANDTNGVIDVFVRDRQLGTTRRVSITSGEAQATGGDSASPSISADGRYVAFFSSAGNLVANDTNGSLDVFVRDRQLGTTRRVSITSAEAQATGGHSSYPSISADGRYVAFQSDAVNLVANDTNGSSDIFVRDRQLGITRRVSITSSEAQATGGQSYEPSVSADGRYVAFHSSAGNLVANDTNGFYDVFVRDRQLGTTRRVSIDSSGGQAMDGPSESASMSGDGRYVAFESDASDLFSGDTNTRRDVFVRDRQLGTTRRVSIDSGGSQADGDSTGASISADGRYIALQSDATDLIANDTNTVTDIFIRGPLY